MVYFLQDSSPIPRPGFSSLSYMLHSRPSHFSLPKKSLLKITNYEDCDYGFSDVPCYLLPYSQVQIYSSPPSSQTSSASSTLTIVRTKLSETVFFRCICQSPVGRVKPNVWTRNLSNIKRMDKIEKENDCAIYAVSTFVPYTHT